MPRSICRRLVCLVVGVGVVGLNAAATVVNFETPHVNPIAMSPDGDTVAVCNTPDDRIEIFDVTGIAPVLTMSIAVGVDPVSVRFRTDTEVWVANQVSDSVSVVDLNVGAVARTLMVVHDADDDLYLDEPADIAFAGSLRFLNQTAWRCLIRIIWIRRRLCSKSRARIRVRLP